MGGSMSKDLVSPDTMEAFLKAHPDWVAQGDAHGLTLRRRYVFSAYPRGLGFVMAAAEHAEKVNHHPDLTLGYRWVVAVLTTHVSRGVTQRDLDSGRGAGPDVSGAHLGWSLADLSLRLPQRTGVVRGGGLNRSCMDCTLVRSSCSG